MLAIRNAVIGLPYAFGASGQFALGAGSARSLEYLRAARSGIRPWDGPAGG
jgi:hypothetical protein